MHTTLSPTEQLPTTCRRRATGAGARLGLEASTIYLAGYALLLLGADLLSGRWATPDGVTSGVGAVGIVLVFGALIGVLPATALGALTGFVMSWILAALRTNLTRRMAVWIAVTVSGAIAASITIVFVLMVRPGLEDGVTYGVFIGVPSLVYIVLSVWKSGDLFQELMCDSV